MDVVITALLVYLAIANALTFIAYGADKARARRGARRTPEKVLILLAFLGGGIGASAGMLVFRHKTRKWRFRICVPIALVLTLVVGASALYLGDYYRADDDALRALVGETQAADAGAAGLQDRMAQGGDGETQAADVETAGSQEQQAGAAGAAGDEAVGAREQDIEIHALEDGAIVLAPHDPRAGMVFYPGAKVEPESYAALMRRCAEEGILCVIAKPPFNLAILDVQAADRAIAQLPAIEHWIVAGHSMGGVAAAQYCASHAGDVDGIALLASYSPVDLSDFGGAAISLVGSNDTVLNWQNYEEAAPKLPDGAIEVIIEGGNHAYFGNYGEQAGDGQATITRDDQQAQTARQIAILADAL